MQPVAGHCCLGAPSQPCRIVRQACTAHSLRGNAVHRVGLPRDGCGAAARRWACSAAVPRSTACSLRHSPLQRCSLQCCHLRRRALPSRRGLQQCSASQSGDEPGTSRAQGGADQAPQPATGARDPLTPAGAAEQQPQQPLQPAERPAVPLPQLGDAVGTVAWGGRLPSRRRALLGGLGGLSIVLVSNLAGVTSGLLGALGGGAAARRLRLDALYPVAGRKRCIDAQNGYEFVYPARWLADQRLYRRYAERLEQRMALDPPSLRQQRRRRVAEPSAAYGPAGGNGEDNISVIVAPIAPDFQLESLGSPAEAGRRFLQTTVAPPGSDKRAAVVAAAARTDAGGQLYYAMEFTVASPTWQRHNVAVYAVRDGLLYTLNGQCSEERWPSLSADLQAAADSFQLTQRSSRAPAGSAL